MNNKIERYEEYCRQDRELVAAHPEKKAYLNRLRNHEAKLERMKARAAAVLEATVEEKPLPMTFAQYSELVRVCRAYEASLEPGAYPSDGFWSVTPCQDGDGPVEWEKATEVCFEVYDFDRAHDFGWLAARLAEIGFPCPPTASCFDGDGIVERWGNCAVFGYNIPVVK